MMDDFADFAVLGFDARQNFLRGAHIMLGAFGDGQDVGHDPLVVLLELSYGRVDLAGLFAHITGAFPDFGDVCFRGFGFFPADIDRIAARGDLLGDIVDLADHVGQNVIDQFRLLARGFGQFADFRRDDGKAFAVFAGMRRFDRRVHGQQVRLGRDALDRIDDLADPLVLVAELLHLLHGSRNHLLQIADQLGQRGHARSRGIRVLKHFPGEQLQGGGTACGFADDFFDGMHGFGRLLQAERLLFHRGGDAAEGGRNFSGDRPSDIDVFPQVGAEAVQNLQRRLQAGENFISPLFGGFGIFLFFEYGFLELLAEPGGKGHRHRGENQEQQQVAQRFAGKHFVMIKRRVVKVCSNDQAEHASKDDRFVVGIERHEPDVHVYEKIGAHDGFGILIDQQKGEHGCDGWDDEHDVARAFVGIRHIGGDGAADAADDDQRHQHAGLDTDHQIGQDAQGDHNPDDFDEKFVPSL